MKIQASHNSWDASRKNLYFWSAIAGAMLVFVGFARTYFLKEFFAAPPLTLLVHVHGVVLSLWFVLLVVQIRLVEIKRTDLHRRLGVAGATLALLIILISVAVTYVAGKRIFRFDETRALTAVALLCGVLADFSVFVGAALLYRRQPQVHKRLMLLATCSILTPGVSRVPLHFILAGGFWVTNVIVDLFTVICVALDTASHRRLSPTFAWGTVFLLLNFPVFLLLSKSRIWIDAVSAILR
jgi:uncharacterized membrane protein YozB (DUF420 family)